MTKHKQPGNKTELNKTKPEEKKILSIQNTPSTHKIETN